MNMKRIKKLLFCVSAMALFIVLGMTNVGHAEKGVDENQILVKAHSFLENYWQHPVKVDFEELSKEYLLPGNDLFNKEMQVRTEVFNAFSRDQYDNWTKMKIGEVRPLEVVPRDDFYYVTGNIYREYYQPGKSEPEDSSYPEDVIFVFRNIDNKLYLTDFIDGLSFRFNKGFGANYIPSTYKFKSEGYDYDGYDMKTLVPYGVNILSDDFIPDENNLSESELKERQLENIEAAKQSLIKQFKHIFNCSDETVEEDNMVLSERSGGTYELDREKAKAYAVKWGSTKPYCNRNKYIYIPDYMGAGYDCANFASQVLHESGCAFSTTDTSKKFPEEWFAMRNGTIYTPAWANAKDLKNYIENNTKSWHKKGPVYWRVTNFAEKDNTMYPGDLVFLCSGKTAYHTLVISDKGGRNRAEYCAHSDGPGVKNVSNQSLYNKIKNSPNVTFIGYNISCHR